jgi:hypothetical protein
MPLFEWFAAVQVATGVIRMVRDEGERFQREVEGLGDDVSLDRDRAELARLLAYRPEREDAEEVKLARSRWLEANRAERSFSCGIVPDPVLAETDPGRTRPEEKPPRPLLPSDAGWAAPQRPVETGPPAEPQPLTPLRPMQVIAAVFPNDVVFIREQGEDEEVDEVGRLPRGAIRDVDVVDDHGGHIPEPIHETIEEPRLSFLILRWKNEGVDDEDRFAFRSPWVAWQAARRLMEARKG